MQSRKLPIWNAAEFVFFIRRCVVESVSAEQGDFKRDVPHLLARVRPLSPAATLERGYAIVQDADGQVLRSALQVAPGDAIAVRLAVGRVAAKVTLVDPPADASSGLR